MSSAAEGFPESGDRSAEWFRRASTVTPGGVNSPVRAFGSVGGIPRFIASGAGPYLTDVDGREYVDLVCSWGPMILGHACAPVVDAVREAALRGTSFGTATENEVLEQPQPVRERPAARVAHPAYVLPRAEPGRRGQHVAVPAVPPHRLRLHGRVR